jgi:hypothetical protein
VIASPKKKPIKHTYWQPTMDAWIAEFQSIDDQDERSEFYTTHLHEPFSRLAQANLAAHGLHTAQMLTGEQAIEQLTTHLVSTIKTFQFGKGNAFGYFNMVAKHYLFSANIRAKKTANLFVSLDELFEHAVDQIPAPVHAAPDTETFDRLKAYWEENFEEVFRKRAALREGGKIFIEAIFNQDFEFPHKKALFRHVRQVYQERVGKPLRYCILSNAFRLIRKHNQSVIALKQPAV